MAATGEYLPQVYHDARLLHNHSSSWLAGISISLKGSCKGRGLENATFLGDQNERLVLHLPNDREYNQGVFRELTLKAIGPADVNLDIIITRRWDMSALIADQFSRGRVFLVGDAAHALPPNRGGYGANTGIADATEFILLPSLGRIAKE
ncbi:hypothetical protein N7540_008871 [Penicillium herquei]|nr:hypothetical protein N7540_008871 [Penicillium herquei]